MAVQAQYPSNIFLLNRNDQELQLQAEDILHQSQMLYNNGGAMDLNPRKRMREIGETPVSIFQLQSQPPPPTFVDLAQLHNPPQAMVSTGLRLAFEDHQQQQMGLLLPPPSNFSSFLSEDLAAQIKQQGDEIDQILKTQAEQLRLTLAEGRRRHQRLLLAVAEQSAQRRLREKAAEVEKGSRRLAELEERMARLKAEAEAWEARARAHEAAAASLQVQLRQAMTVAAGGGAHDKEGEQQGCAEDAESAQVDPGRVLPGAPPCQVCRHRSVSVLLLPCRHLCVCNGCDTNLVACPICRCLRSTSVEVFFS